MQADCAARYMRCDGENAADELAPDLACMSSELCERPSLRQPGRTSHGLSWRSKRNWQGFSGGRTHHQDT